MTFVIKILDQKFVVSYCTNCEKTVWPPSEFCNRCFSASVPKAISPIGKLVEFSKKNDQSFGLVEFDGNIRVIARLQESKTLYEGVSARLEKCNLVKNNYDFEVSIEK